MDEEREGGEPAPAPRTEPGSDGAHREEIRARAEDAMARHRDALDRLADL